MVTENDKKTTIKPTVKSRPKWPGLTCEQTEKAIAERRAAHDLKVATGGK